MRRRLYGLALVATGAERWLCAREEPPSLASSISQPRVPTVVLVHGLDSSKQTWTSVQASLGGLPSLAVDLRGHGDSALGSPAAFSAEALARDVIRCVEEQHGIGRPWIIVGHSMGARVAMRVAAIAASTETDMLGACILEDMDCVVRAKPEGAPETFERLFESWADARHALVSRGYDEKRVDSWRGARVRELPDGTWWSDVNPEARWLARDRVLASTDGDEAWSTLAGLQDVLPFSIHLWVADDADTVVTWDGPAGIRDLSDRLPAVSVVKFPGSAHSIHNTARPAFVRELVAVVGDVVKRGV